MCSVYMYIIVLDVSENQFKNPNTAAYRSETSKPNELEVIKGSVVKATGSMHNEVIHVQKATADIPSIIPSSDPPEHPLDLFKHKEEGTNGCTS